MGLVPTTSVADTSADHNPDHNPNPGDAPTSGAPLRVCWLLR